MRYVPRLPLPLLGRITLRRVVELDERWVGRQHLRFRFLDGQIHLRGAIAIESVRGMGRPSACDCCAGKEPLAARGRVRIHRPIVHGDLQRCRLTRGLNRRHQEADDNHQHGARGDPRRHDVATASPVRVRQPRFALRGEGAARHDGPQWSHRWHGLRCRRPVATGPRRRRRGFRCGRPEEAPAPARRRAPARNSSLVWRISASARCPSGDSPSSASRIAASRGSSSPRA